MKALRGILLLVVGVLALAAAILWWQVEPDAVEFGGGRPAYVLPVTLAEVQLGTLRPTLQLTGNVRAERFAQLAFERQGILSELLVRDAQEVVAGEIIARLNARDAKLSVARTKTDVLVARLLLESLEAGARDEVVRRLEAELEAARAGESLAELEVERRTSLAKEHDVSQSEMDRVLATLREARALTAAATERHAEAVAGTRSEDLAIAEAQLQAAHSELQLAERELEKTEITAPWAGTVVRRFVSVGDFMQLGEVCVELIDREHLEIHLEVPASAALHVTPGTPLTIRSDADPNFEMRAQIDATIPSADLRSRNFRAISRVLRSEQTDDVLRPGMFVRVKLDLAPRDNVLLVPSDAVRLTEAGFLVARADANDDDSLSAHWVFVELLGQDANGTAVRALNDELAPGDHVIVVGVDLSYEGVRLLPRGGETP